MNTARQQVAPKEVTPIQQVRDDLGRMSDQFRFALPDHIPVERFLRVIMTAVQNNRDLLRCTKESFFNACVKAAQDGLLPDGREAALVPYGEDDGGNAKRDICQYLPMVAGIRKKVRNSGALTDWNVQVVQEGDEFDYRLGDSPFIHHKPAARGGRTRPVLFAYSIATYPDGTKSREVMNIDQINDIRSLAKAKRGPWGNPIFFPEMCRKTVARLHSKQLPMSTDLDTLFRRDDEFFKPLPGREQTPRDVPRPTSVAAALDHFASDPPADTRRPASGEHPATPASDTRRPAPDTGPAQQPDEPAGKPNQPASGGAPEGEAQPAADPDTVRRAYDAGREARQKGTSRRDIPAEYRDAARGKEAIAWHRGWNGETFEA
jgi:recombination protein RecT